MAEHFSLEEALDVFDEWQDSDDSVSNPRTAASTSAPLLQVKELKTCALPSQAHGILRSAMTPLPAMGVLVSVLPNIITKAGKAEGTLFPPFHPSQRWKICPTRVFHPSHCWSPA